MGASAVWPDRLKFAVELVLAMPQPACVCWGADARLIYNDAYRAVLAHRHPSALGEPIATVWREFAEQIGPRVSAVLAGRPQIWEDASYDLDRGDGALQRAWFSAFWIPIASDDGRAGGFIITATETTAQHQAEAERRLGQDERAFLLELSDAIRPLADAGDVQSVAAEALGVRLGASRVGYAEDLGGDSIAVTRNYVRGVPSIEGRYRYDDYGAELLASFRQGRIVVRPDIAADATLSAAEKAAHAALQLGATVNIPLLKDGVLRAVLFVHFQAPHEFTPAELALMSAVAERTWAEVMRARAEQETQRAKERYHALFSSMDEGYCIIQMLYDPDGRAIDFRYLEVNPAFEIHNGLSGAAGRTIRQMAPDIETKWIDVYNRVAETGESTRFQEISGALQDRTFDLYAFRVGDPEERKVAVLFTNITEAKRLADRQAVLLAELQHRVRNTLAMIRAISDRSIGSAPSLDAFATAWRGRLATLSRVQALLTRTADLGVDLTELVREEIAAQAEHAGQFSLEGPSVTLPPRAAEVLTLAMHELTTNALKHGALSSASGRVNVTWRITGGPEQPWLTLTWTEDMGAERLAPSAPRQGFGRELIERRIPYDLKGRAVLTLSPTGARCELSFPLRSAPSVLQTGVPHRHAPSEAFTPEGPAAQVDARCRILILEDEFLLADDVARILVRAGASVVGPFATESAALEALAGQAPALAVLDIDLGAGPSFDLARVLRGRSIPFCFLTGYDEARFPEDLRDVPRLQKPIGEAELLAAIRRLRKGVSFVRNTT